MDEKIDIAMNTQTLMESFMPYILETVQYEGLGQRLVYTLVEWLKENDFSNMLVWVLADNSAKLFYKKLGAG